MIQSLGKGAGKDFGGWTAQALEVGFQDTRADVQSFEFMERQKPSAHVARQVQVSGSWCSPVVRAASHGLPFIILKSSLLRGPMDFDFSFLTEPFKPLPSLSSK